MKKSKLKHFKNKNVPNDLKKTKTNQNTGKYNPNRR